MSLEQKSKHLSYILRHRPESANLILDTQGWTRTGSVIQNTDITLVELQQLVAEDAKGRYSFSSDGTMIRANQGHSANVTLSFTKKIPPPVLFHGTSAAAWALIQKSGGLQPMSRHHVHLSADKETAFGVAARRRGLKLVLLKISTGGMVKNKQEFLISENGVWLVPGVDLKYIEVIA